MNKLPNLTDHELHATLLNALHVAADKYRDNARELRASKWRGNEQLADQFDRQAREASELANKLEETSTEA